MRQVDDTEDRERRRQVTGRWQRLLLVEWLREACLWTMDRPSFDAFQDAKVIGGLARTARDVVANLNKEQ